MTGDLSWLDAIEARLAAATPGPWHNNPADWLEIWADRDAAGWDAFFIATLRTDLNPDPGIRAAHDASFIAHAPADIARLVNALRDAHAKIARVETLTEGPFSDGYRPYAMNIDGEVMLAVGLDDLRAALAGEDLPADDR